MLKECNDISRVPANLLYNGSLVGHTTRHTGRSLTFQTNGAVKVVAGQALIQSAGGIAENVVRVNEREVFGAQVIPPYAGGFLYVPGFHCTNGGPTCEPCNDQALCDIMPNGPSIGPGTYVDNPPLGVQCGFQGQPCCPTEPICQAGLLCTPGPTGNSTCEFPPDGGT